MDVEEEVENRRQETRYQFVEVEKEEETTNLLLFNFYILSHSGDISLLLNMCRRTERKRSMFRHIFIGYIFLSIMSKVIF